MDFTMDFTMDFISFDLQSTHLSYEERRWLYEQRKTKSIDKMLNEMDELHKMIISYPNFSQTEYVPLTPMNDTDVLYYQTLVDEATDNKIDLFRLHRLQMIQSLFKDFDDHLFKHFTIIIEGYIFYASQTVFEYGISFMSEMRSLLSNFDLYCETRIKKIIKLTKLIHRISKYTTVHSTTNNNIGVLYQLLPKIRYTIPTHGANSILCTNDYLSTKISFEELRYIDYETNLKWKRHHQPLAVISKPTIQKHSTGLYGDLAVTVQHSLSIIYPYNDKIVFNKKYPQYWQQESQNETDNDSEDALFKLVSIEKDSGEYAYVDRLFHKTIPFSFRTVAIERVENRYLWEKFVSHRNYMKKKNKGILNEEWMFHGTSSDNHQRILAHGFNRSYCKETVIYGMGVYFARHSIYSHSYTDGGALANKDISSMVLCRVLVGQYGEGSSGIKLAPNIIVDNKEVRCDSTTDHKKPFTIVCTFHDNQIYPEYVISYSINLF